MRSQDGGTRPADPEPAPASGGARQFVRYSFYRVLPEWRRLPAAERDAGKREFAAVVDEMADRTMLRTYSTVGTRPDTDLMLWHASGTIDDFHTLARQLLSTRIGGYLETPHAFLAMTRRSTYVEEHRHPGQEGARERVQPQGARYLIVYPFVKTRPWYALSKADRQRAMNDHIATGHRYPSVRINTSYSFGLDDQEFVVAFETDSPGDFLDLVMELREGEASSYTLRDTPSFTCIAADIRNALDALGG